MCKYFSCYILRFWIGIAMLLVLLLANSTLKAQCYENFNVYQAYPYGTLCYPQNVTLQAQYYSDGSNVSGEFRWYTSDSDPTPVQTNYIYSDFGSTTADYNVYAANGITIWVSFYNYNTGCESYRMPYTFYVSSTPNLYQNYARQCYNDIAKIQLSSDVAGVTFQLYKLYEYYDPYWGYRQEYQHVDGNSTGYFEIYDFNPADQQNYYAKVSQPYGCSTPYYYSLSIDIPDPAPPTVSGNTTFCQGGQTTLTANGSSYNYRWFDVATNTQLYEGTQYTVPSTLSPGTKSYRVQGISYSGCVTNPNVFEVTINPKPVDGTIQANATTICLGQAITISSQGGTGTPYYWCSTNGGQSWNVFAGAFIGQNSFQHTPATVGTYRYHLRNQTPCGFCWDPNGGGCTTHPYVDVTVVAPPVITTSISNPVFGQGEKVLTSSIATGSFQWQFNQTDIPGAISKTHVAGSSGNYSVKVTSPTGCVSISSPVAVSVNENNYVITNTI